MADLTWTDEPPSEAGWYWMRNRALKFGPKVVQVARPYRGSDDLAFYDQRSWNDLRRHTDAQWAGPIPEPSEPDR